MPCNATRKTVPASRVDAGTAWDFNRNWTHRAGRDLVSVATQTPLFPLKPPTVPTIQHRAPAPDPETGGPPRVRARRGTAGRLVPVEVGGQPEQPPVQPHFLAEGVAQVPILRGAQSGGSGAIPAAAPHVDFPSDTVDPGASFVAEHPVDADPVVPQALRADDEQLLPVGVRPLEQRQDGLGARR